MRIYLAGAMNGCTDEEMNGWRTKAKELLKDHEILDPTIRDYRGRELEDPAAVVEQDKADIDSCDILLVGFTKPSVGTSMEVLYAWERDKPVYIIMLEGEIKRMSPWLYYHSVAHFENIEDASIYIERLF